MRRYFLHIFICSLFTANVYAIEGGSLSYAEPAVGVSAYSPMTEGQCAKMATRCTGTLIAPNAVLSAAHCLNGTHDYHFKACEYDEYNDPIFYIGRNVKEIIVHPKYYASSTRRPRNYDLAIHILEKPVTNIMPIPILDRQVNLGEDVVMLGYGHDAGNDIGFKRIGYNSISANNGFQIWTSHSTGAKARPGDSGSPALVYDDNGMPHIAGVGSYTTKDVTAYTNVTAHTKWIKEVVELKKTTLATQVVYLKSAHGRYFVNEKNGGANQVVRANRIRPDLWEEMTIEYSPKSGTCLRHGDDISISSSAGFYWSATSDGELNVSSKTKYISSSFKLLNHSNRQRCLQHEDRISLRSNALNKSHVVADQRGRAKANSKSIGTSEIFNVIFKGDEGAL